MTPDPTTHRAETPSADEHVDAPCALCGLDSAGLPFAETRDGETLHFCCEGCRRVYGILREGGMLDGDPRETALYRLSERAGLIRQQRRAAAARPAASDAKDLRTDAFEVAGMWCASCAWLIEEAACRVSGVVEANVNFMGDAARVTYDPMRTTPTAIHEAVERFGYRVVEPTKSRGDEHEREVASLVRRVGVAAFFSANIMMLSLALYARYIDSVPVEVRRYLPWILFVLALPVVLYSGAPIFRQACSQLARRRIAMDALIALGVSAAFLYSIYGLIAGTDYVYFDTCSMLVTLVLVGRLVQAGAKRKARAGLRSLLTLVPRKARALIDGAERFVAVDALRPGMVVRILEGETITADGVVVSGAGEADESPLTGESLPRPKAPGDRVIASSRLLTGPLDVRVERVGAESFAGTVARLVETAQGRRTRGEHLADSVARVFVPLVAVGAVATVVIATVLGLRFDQALLRGIALVVIACPCTFGIAIPLAKARAIGRAAAHGIVVRNPEAFEALRRAGVVVFDKTGTLTEGAFSVESVDAFDGDADDVLAMAAAVERGSNHPIARALVQAAADRGLDVPAADEQWTAPGRGAGARVEGKLVIVGSARLLDERGIAVDAYTSPGGNATAVFVAVDGRHAATIAVADRVRESTPAAIDELRRDGLSLAVISGDAEAPVQAVARALDIEPLRWGALPEEKVAAVGQLQQAGRTVVVVGDGINDAPALSAADVSISMGSGTELARDVSDIALLSDRLTGVGWLIGFSRRWRRIIRQNLAWAFAYNAAAIPLAVLGLLSPVFAAAAMLVSSTTVVLNTSRLR